MKMMSLLVKAILWIVALFYVYGATVHILNIASLTGFDWPGAPLKWQILDFIYLVIDVVVAVGFFAKWRIAYFAFYVASVSQILLYTAMREWIIEVPEEFALSAEQIAYLDSLIAFHIVTIILVSFALWSMRNESRQRCAIKSGSSA